MNFRDLIQPDQLEEMMVTVSLKHLGVSSVLEIVGAHMSTQEVDVQTLEILQAVFLRVDALLRRLQVCQKLCEHKLILL